jgi:hypothetical protein
VGVASVSSLHSALKVECSLMAASSGWVGSLGRETEVSSPSRRLKMIVEQIDQMFDVD